MEAIPPNQEQSQTSNNTGRSQASNGAWNLHALAFLEVGIFELFFVSIVLALLFGILNYFNILPVSSVFPKYFSFLPRREVSSGTSRQKFTIPKTTPIPTPNPTSVSKTLSSSEKEIATKISQDLINKFIKPEYQSTITLEEKSLIIDNKPQPFPYYSASWQKASVSASLVLQYDFITRNTTNVDINLDTPTIKDTVTASSAGNIAEKYVVLPLDTQFTCDNPTSLGVVQCSSMVVIRQDKSKIGFSLTASPKEAPLGAKNSIFICQTFPSSNRYSWSSCLHP